MFSKAKTMKISHRIMLKGNQMHFAATTVLDIYGQSSYDHTDANTLQKVE
ncbi:MAG: hypothetical protein ACI9HY_002618 [Planctomycetaceae bacterium]|jgi:hypothetical protein